MLLFVRITVKHSQLILQHVSSTFEEAVTTTCLTTFLNGIPSGPAGERFAGTRQCMNLSPKLRLAAEKNGYDCNH